MPDGGSSWSIEQCSTGFLARIVALGEGASAQVAGQLAGLGVNVLTIQPGSTRTGGASTGAGSSTSLKASDTGAIAAISGVTAVSPVVSGNVQVIAGSQNWSTRAQGVLPGYLTINAWTINQGAAFTVDDNTNSANVALIGQTVYTNLFPNGQSPVGQSIQIRNVPFTVVGLLTSKGSTTGGNQDDVIMIPFNTGQVRLFGSSSVNQIVLQVADASQIPTVTAEITTVLRQLHRLSPGQPADFTIQSNNDVISRVSSVTSTLTTLLGGVAAVSLVVGGIGIMNIMLVSVTERTREIGIRKALGATRWNILGQFLIEAVVLCCLGGIIGIAVGAGGAIAMAKVAGF